MINDIINALSLKLFEKFNRKIYFEQIPQNFEENCFFIKVISNKEEQVVGHRYKVNTTFDIAYLSNPNNSDSEYLYNLLHQINDITDFLTLENGDVLRGTNRNNQINDGDLHHVVSYQHFRIKEHSKADYMENLEHKGGIKDNG